ncbi:MAG: vWA domain-containing protein [Anaerovoracaceae bacterium]|nr:vWA domain-containing protein [Anaerovoracaceae bacterium]
MRTGKSLHDKTRKVLLIAFAMLFALSCVTASAVYQSASAKDSDSARNVKAAAAAETGFDPKGGKTIDYLGDDGSNPDTSLRGEDFYRLYLDFPGKTKTSTETTTEKQNVDVIFCLDFSASMDSAMSAADSTKRYEAMANIMTSDTVKKILDDPNNKVSVVGFYGNSQERLYISGTLQAGYYYTPSGGSLCPQNSKINPLFKDAETLFDWTNNKDVFSKLHDDIITKFTELNGEISQSSKHLRYMQGTNYTAGFRQMLSQLKEVQDDGNKKILVFLSDGVPTYYFPDIDVKANQDKIDQAKQYAGALVHGRYGNGSEVNCPVTGEGSDQLYPKNLETNCYGTLNVWNGSNQDKVNEIKGEIESYGYHGTDDYGHTINQISNIYTPDKGQVQQKLRDMDMNLTTYTIGVSNEFDPAKDGSSYDGYVVTDEKGITKCGGNPYVLKQMADTESDINTPGKFFEATNSQEVNGK